MYSDCSRSRKGKWRRAIVCLRCINGHLARDRVASAGHRRCNSIHIGSAEGANIRPVHYPLTDLCDLLTDLCATGVQRLDAQRRTVVPAHVARSRHCCRSGAGFGSTLHVEAIPRFSSSFPKAGESLRASLWLTLRAHNCGACRPTVGIRGRGNSSFG